MPDWSKLAKLAGMLGSPYDGERLNAARLLQRALDSEGLTFGQLSERIANGGNAAERVVYVDREVIVVERAEPNPAAKVAAAIVDCARHRLSYAELRFLTDIIDSADMTSGKFALSTHQANWLNMLKQQHFKPKARYMKPPKRGGAVPQDLLDACGLGEPVKASKDMEDHIGAFRSRMAGQRPREKVKPNPHTVQGAPDGRYRGDFDRDPVDTSGDDGLGLDDITFE